MEAMTRVLTDRILARNASSSPPPGPPEEVYMREGLDDDDIYMQVEDEFLTTASLFTRHLHHAEYKRQKQLARTKNEGRMQSITRPVDGRTALSTESRKKLEGSKLQHNGRIAVTNIYGDGKDASDEDEDDPWLRDPRLAGLMVRKQKSAPLAKITGVQSTSRAAMGYSQGKPSPGKSRIVSQPYASNLEIRREESPLAELRHVSFEGDDDSDDLDAPLLRASTSLQLHASQLNQPLHSSSTVKKPPDKAQTASWRSRPALKKPHESPFQSKASISATKIANEDEDDDQDLFDPFPLRRHRVNEPKPITKASALTKKKKEDESRNRSIKAEEIPTFLV
jgi:hypothetical protein